MKTTTKEIRRVIKKAGGREKVAQAFNMNTSNTVWHWENGSRFPSEKNLLKLSRLANTVIKIDGRE